MKILSLTTQTLLKCVAKDKDKVRSVTVECISVVRLRRRGAWEIGKLLSTKRKIETVSFVEHHRFHFFVPHQNHELSL